jgi:hypothetical protein
MTANEPSIRNRIIRRDKGKAQLSKMWPPPPDCCP